MEYAYAKHILLERRHELLMAQYEHLEKLPVGFEAFEEEYNQMFKADEKGSGEGCTEVKESTERKETTDCKDTSAVNQADRELNEERKAGKEGVPNNDNNNS